MRADQQELMELEHKVGFFEDLVEDLYGLLTTTGDVCVDAGANLGRHTLPMAACVGRTGAVHAFEPIPELAERLRRVAFDDYPQVAIHEFALSDHQGRAEFQFVRNVTGLSGLKRRSHPQPIDDEMIEVSVTTLDEELGALPSWKFYKLDIEGAELAAIKGSRGLIARHRPVIVFENGFDKTAELFGYSKDEWFGVFAELGYNPYDLYGYPITPDRWPDFCQPYYSIAVHAGSPYDPFVQGRWRTQVDRVIALAKSRRS